MTHNLRPRLHLSVILIHLFIFFLNFQSIEAQIISPNSSNPNSPRDEFIRAARNYRGTPYKLGGISRSGMDCSGLIYTAALEGLSIKLPRTAHSMSTYCTQISDSAREPGDLLFFGTITNITHVAIYLGAGTFIHVASDGPRTGVIISDLGEPYWRKTYRFAGRFLKPETINWPSPGEPSTTEQNPVPVNRNPILESVTTQPREPKPFDGKIGFHLKARGTLLWDIMPGVPFIRGVNLGAELTWVRGITLYPGIGAGFTFDSRTESYSIPLTFSVSTMEGFSFYLGTQFHLIINSELDKKPQFPGILGVSWNSPEAYVLGQHISFYQAIEYSWFPNETLGTGFRFSTGLNLRYSL